MKAKQILQGRREAELLASPSVARMAEILAQRCREPSWVRTSVASLERFRTMTDNLDLEALRERALANPVVAEQALISLASALAGYADCQISALAMGPKLWFRFSGIAVPWRPLSGVVASSSLAIPNQHRADQIILLALIGSGLRLAELLRLRIGDIGSLNSEGHLIPDIEADPLAVQFVPRRGKPVERITFLTYQTRQVLLASLQQRFATERALDLEAPLIVASAIQARQRNRSLIRAGNEVNVTLCQTTGNFFREWGLPGSRFEGPEDLNIEEYI